MAQSPLLFTPGPLTTQLQTHRAMLNDWGSREPASIAITTELRRRLLEVASGRGSHVAILPQGSGTLIVKAAIGTPAIPSDLLVFLMNGAYGERMMKIAKRLGSRVEALRWPDGGMPIRGDLDQAAEPGTVERVLADNPAITHVALVQCETTSGLLNPPAAMAAVVVQRRRTFIVDAMSRFSALPLELRETPITMLLASSNKCLDGVPGSAHVLIEKYSAEHAKRVSVIKALRFLEAEGGPASRLQRYQDNFRTLTEGMRRLGFRVSLDEGIQAPTIVTVLTPEEPRFYLDDLYGGWTARGFIISPGKLARAQSFRIGCIGALHTGDFDRLVVAIADIMADFKLDDLSPRGGAPCLLQ